MAKKINTIIYNSDKKDKEKKILVQFISKRKIVFSRYYKHLSSAVPRAIQLVLLGKAEPGDVIEFSHILTGLQYGVIKVRVGGYDIRFKKDTEI